MLSSCPVRHSHRVVSVHSGSTPDRQKEEGDSERTGGRDPPSTSEIIKRKLHQRLMAGRAKKRRMSRDLSPSELMTSRPGLADAELTLGGHGHEPFDELRDGRTANLGMEEGMLTKESTGTTFFSGLRSQGLEVNPAALDYLRGPIGLESGADARPRGQYDDLGEEGPIAAAPRGVEGSPVEGKSPLEGGSKTDGMAARIGGSIPGKEDVRLFGDVIGDESFKNRNGRAVHCSIQQGFAEPMKMLPSSAMADNGVGGLFSFTPLLLPFASRCKDTPRIVQSEDNSDESRGIEDAMGQAGVRFGATFSDDSVLQRSLAVHLDPIRVALEEVPGIGQLPKLKKKKTKRAPKVKKIKFHEYKGPNRRAVVPKPKPIQANSLPLPGTRPGNAFNADRAINQVASTVERSDNLLILKQYDATKLLPPVVASEQNLSQTSREVHAAKSLNPSLPNKPLEPSPVHSSSLLKPPEPPIPILMEGKIKEPGTGQSLPGLRKPVTPPVAKAGTSAPLLVPFVARHNDHAPERNGRVLNGSVKKQHRREVAIISAPVSLDDLKVVELKQECKKRKLSVTGPKPRLVTRLLPYADDILSEKSLPSVESDSSADSRPDSMNAISGAFLLPPNGNSTTKFRKQETASAAGISGSISGSTAATELPLLRNEPVVSSANGASGVQPFLTADRCPWTSSSTKNSTTCCLLTNSGCWEVQKPRLNQLEEERFLSINNEKAVVQAKPEGNSTPSDRKDLPSVTSNDALKRTVFQGGVPLERTQFEGSSTVQQQFLTPPTTPTLLVSATSSYPSETEAQRSFNRLTGQTNVSGENRSRVVWNEASLLLSDAELWMLQERQIVELQHQLQKSKAELIHARRKICLDHYSQLSPSPSVVLVDKAEICHTIKPLAHVPLVTPRSVFEGDSKYREHHPLERISGASILRHPKTVLDFSNDQSSIRASAEVDVPRLLIPSLTRTSISRDDGRVTDGLASRDALQTQRQTYEVKFSPNGLGESAANNDEDNYSVLSPCSFTSVKKPPEYHEAIRQKLLQSKASEARETAVMPAAATAEIASMSATFDNFSCVGPLKEEIEDVLDVLLGSGELNATDIPSSDRHWIGQHETSPQEPTSSSSYSSSSSSSSIPFSPTLGFASGALARGLQSPNHGVSSHSMRAHWLVESSCRTEISESPHGARKEEGFVDAGPGNSDDCKTALDGAVGPSWVNEGIPSSIYLTELPFLGFEWNDQEASEHPSLGGAEVLWCSYPSPNESNLSSTPNGVNPDSTHSLRSKHVSTTGCQIRALSAVTSFHSKTASIGCDSNCGPEFCLGLLSPDLTPGSANPPTEPEMESVQEPTPKRNDAHDSQEETDWFGAFIDSKNFLESSQLLGNSSSHLLSTFGFPQ